MSAMQPDATLRFNLSTNYHCRWNVVEEDTTNGGRRVHDDFFPVMNGDANRPIRRIVEP